MFGFLTISGHLITVTAPIYSPFLFIALVIYIWVFQITLVIRLIRLFMPF